MKGNECGSCTLCCELLPIVELKKPHSKLCSNCTISDGCGIYNERPNSCRNFDCVFLSSDMKPNLRPDKCRVMFEKVTNNLYLGMIDPKNLDVWGSTIIQDHIKELNENNISVILSSFTNEPKRFYPAKNTTKENMLSSALNEFKKIK